MLEPFGATSNWAQLDGPVHYAEWPGPDQPEGPPLVLVHGLGGSHANWLAVGAGLAAQRRVVAPDLSGFGRTPPASRGSSVDANRRLLAHFVDEVVGEPAVLAGNSMGGAISILQAAADPASTAGIVLVCSALPRAPWAPIDPAVAREFALHAVPVVGGRWLRRRLDRLGPEGITRETLELCCADVSRVPEDVIEAGIELRRERMSMPWAYPSFLEASRTLMLELLRRSAFDAEVARVEAPGLILQGAQDRLVPEVNARRLASLRPDWRYELWQDVGHVPQLEVPERFVELVGGWLATIPAPALGA